MTTSEQSSDPTITNDGYGSTYAADYYHSLTQLPGWVQDKPVYCAAHENMRNLRKTQPDAKDGPYIVLDVGTGTGRVIRDLVASLSKHDDANVAATKFLGLDLSQHMLDQAARLPMPSKSADVAWIQGSALDLRAVPAVDSVSGNIDLLIFAFSSICHFTEPGQPEQFLREVARVLRPGTGRAYISIHHSSMSGSDDQAYTDFDSPYKEVASSVYPGVVYRELKNDGAVNGNVASWDTDMQVVGKGDGGHERALETFTIHFVLRSWGHDEFPTLASSAGLTVAETLKTDIETFYILQVPE